jgi:hypothetical protein
MGESASAATDQASGASAAVPALVTWCLGTFHIAVLTVVAVLALQRGASIGNALSGLDTAIGLGLYAFLWALTWWTTRRGLRAAWHEGRGPTWKSGIAYALVWGGATGVVFFAGLFAVVFVLLVAQGAVALATLGVGVIGVVVAVVVGAVIGGMLGVLDVMLLRAARRLAGTVPPGRR